MFAQATLLLALAASATAHLRLLNPVPFSKDTLSSSPLALADYPCKQRAGMYDITKMNQWNAGETQMISFLGSAVHGGGSCQFSITTDTEPTEASQFKVIHSIEGGCPSNNTKNLDENPDGLGAAVFPVTMPDNIPDGQYTFAWTWLNKVGNREFYMNCAPVQVGSASTAKNADTANAASVLAALPDMQIANLGNNDCVTIEEQDFKFPNPGSSLVVGELASLGVGKGCGAGSGSGGNSAPSQAQSSAAPVASSAPVESVVLPSPSGVVASSAYAAPVVSSAPAVSSIAAVPTSNAAGPGTVGVVVTTVVDVTQTVVETPTSFVTLTPSSVGGYAPAQPTYSAPTYETPDNTSGSSKDSSDGDCTACSEHNAIVCIGTTQFGICNHGCVVAQALSGGMTCSNGVVSRSVSKRQTRFPRGHLHRRHGSRFM